MATAPSVSNITLQRWSVDNNYMQATWSKVTKKLNQVKEGKTLTKVIETVTDLELLWVWKVVGPNGKDLVDGSSAVTLKNNSNVYPTTATFQIPNGATQIRIGIRPVPAKKTDKKNKEHPYWSKPAYKYSKWYPFKQVSTKPNAPNLTMDSTGSKASISINNLENTVTKVEFILYRTAGAGYPITKHFSQEVAVKYQQAGVNVDLWAGYSYFARVRIIVSGKDWSEWSDDSSTITAKPPGMSESVFTSCRAVSSTVVELSWNTMTSISKYEIQYFNSLDDVDTTGGTIVTVENSTTARLTLETGKTYYFRLRAINENNLAGIWSPQYKENYPSVTLGLAPAAPNTYSLVSTIVPGETIRLYWVHNARDNSVQVCARIWFKFYTINDTALEGYVDRYNPNYGDEVHQNDTMFEEIDTSETYVINNYRGGPDLNINFSEIVKFDWHVKTAGVTGEYGAMSVTRTVTVAAKPVLQLSSSLDGSTWTNPETVTSLPLYLKMETQPSSISVLGYSIIVKAAESFTYDDIYGNTVGVSAGSVVFSDYYASEDATAYYELTPAKMTFINDVPYEVTVSVSSSSGFVSEDSLTFTLSLATSDMAPTADVEIDLDEFTATIIPTCEDGSYDIEEHIVIIDGEEHSDGDVPLLEGVTLAVYRVNTDGTLTEIMSGISNNGWPVIDPHPTFPVATYRIVAIDESTGAMAYDDVISEEVDVPGLVINWQETVQLIEETEIDEDMESAYPYIGQILHLPYNVDITESHSPDAELVEYIGRPRPVPYYGTQRGEAYTIKTEIPRYHEDDEEADIYEYGDNIDYTDSNTILKLRRLATYMGPVYIRTSLSKMGFWAHINVSLDDNHATLTIPVTISIAPIDDQLTSFGGA